MEGVIQAWLLIFLLNTWTFCDGADCPSNWFNHNSSCYFFNSNKLTWDQASNWCKKQQSYLVEIEGSEENDFLGKLLAQDSYKYNYIGLRKESGAWKWTTSGKSLKFSSWLSGEPNGDGNCVHFFNDYEWNDFPCSGLYRSICEKSNSCLSNPCVNGTCENLLIDYNCTCTAGYTGRNCGTAINDCSPNLCENGGTCIDGENSYTCTCVDGFDGTNCQNHIDGCSSNPCQNDGTCVGGVNGYNCTCISGYDGTDCSNDINECSSNPCQNDGTCVDVVNGYICTCTSGFDGTDCSSGNDSGKETTVPISVLLIFLCTTSGMIIIIA